MAIKIEFDSENTPLPLRLVLGNRRGEKIKALPIKDVRFRDEFNSASEITFSVYKTDCKTKSGDIDVDLWDQITDLKLAYCPEHDAWYELHIDINEDDSVSKEVTAISLGEAELSQINCYGIEINTESDINRDDYAPTVLYNQDNKEISLMDRLLSKAPHYRVSHVDDSIAGMQRTFKFDGKSVYDSFQDVAKEIDCVFLFQCTSSDGERIDRTVSAYDLESVCLDCGNRSHFIYTCDVCGSSNIRPGYGEDTTIFVSKDNLAQNVKFSRNIDSVKNCFKLKAGDDLMTATIANCNPGGTDYIWFFSDEMREDMSEDLSDRLASYDRLYSDYHNKHRFILDADVVSSYNSIVEKYASVKDGISKIQQAIIGYPALMNSYYDAIDLQLFLTNEMMPTVEMQSTNASSESSKLTSASLSPVAVADILKCSKATADRAVLGMAKCIIDSRYQVKVEESSYQDNIWRGNFVVTNYSDDNDTATSEIVDVEIDEDMQRYIKQKIDRTIAESTDITDISALFNLSSDDLATELRKYCLNRLTTFYDASQAALDILIQQGVADRDKWSGLSAEDNLYLAMYLPQLNKHGVIENEIHLRQDEITSVGGSYDADGNLLIAGVIQAIDEQRNDAQAALNIEAYLGPELWFELSSFRREDVYSNENFISDGLNNAELFESALEFIQRARKDIEKSATSQHSIQSTLSNLLVMKEFSPLVDCFEVGNWIRISVDSTIYKLRLLSYLIDYSDWSLEVEFSDIITSSSASSNIQAILSQAKSMSTSFESVARQASQGRHGQEQIQDWIDNGVDLTDTKIVNASSRQDFILDSNGLLGREYIQENDAYGDEQIKIINHGVFLTDDSWETAKTGIGKFTYYDPRTKKMVDAYGVIASVLVSDLTLTKELGIFNKSGGLVIDDDGVCLTTKATGNKLIFSILRQNEDDSFDQILNLDANGRLNLNGDMILGSLDASKINVKNLNASNIVTGTMSADFIYGGTINGENVNVLNLNADNITAGILDVKVIKAGSIDGSKIKNGEISLILCDSDINSGISNANIAMEILTGLRLADIIKVSSLEVSESLRFKGDNVKWVELSAGEGDPIFVLSRDGDDGGGSGGGANPGTINFSLATKEQIDELFAVDNA